jgi:hypothetical protein
MERYHWEFQDAVFFERYTELSDKHIRTYLDLRRALPIASGPEGKRLVAEARERGEGGIGIEEVNLVAYIEMLCEKGFISRQLLDDGIQEGL